jgi:pimeloyl-ACP methyl ester carboxylesterase
VADPFPLEIVSMQPTLRFVRLPTGVQLEYAEQGDPTGLPVVMLHGITDSWRSFETVMAHLPPSLRVYSLTQRGHGGSDRPRVYRTRDFAADAAGFIETLGLERALVVGHSMGSVNAMRLAIDHPQRVIGLVLAGAFATFRGNPGIAQFHRDAIVPLHDPIEPAFVAEWQRSTLARPIDPAYFDAIVRETLKVPAAVWHGAFGALFDDDFAGELERIDAPALLAWGEADAFCPRADQETILRRVRGARLVAYAGAGHALHWEEPARFAADVAAFAKAASRRAG